MNSNHCYVDLHVLQPLPPSCVNRDDTGSPKTAIYGGTARARVSSQAWKHAMRLMFGQLFSKEDLAQRTKLPQDLVSEKIAALDSSLDGKKLAKAVLKNAGIKIDEKKEQTDALLFISHAQAAALAKLAVEHANHPEEDDKFYKESCKIALKENPSFEIALFGRMVASDPSLNYDAAAQVAHSISTHTVHNAYDYFTAVDDRARNDTSGAAHLDTTEFNSSTLYRYATVNVTELQKSLGEMTPEVVANFVKAFFLSMPTGKQNSFANRTLPDLAYITMRTDQPVNLVGAFENPVKAGSDGYGLASEKRLVEYAQKTYRQFVSEPIASYGIGGNEPLQQLVGANNIMTLEQLLNQLECEIIVRKTEIEEAE